MCLPIIGAENWKPATKTDQGNLKRMLQYLFCGYSNDFVKVGSEIIDRYFL